MSELITLSDNDENVKHITSDKSCLWYKGQQYVSLSRFRENTENYLDIIKQQEKEIKDCKDKIVTLTSYIKILGEE